MRILFLCTGNTCRSPMAMAVMEKLAVEMGLSEEIRCESAGLAAFPGQQANEKAVEAAKELGMDLTGHRSKQATPELLLKADRIVVMTVDQLSFLKRQFPELAGRLYFPAGGIADPYGGTLEDYRACLQKLLCWEREFFTELLAEMGE